MTSAIDINVKAVSAGQTFLGVACCAVWEFYSAGSAEFGLGVLVVGRLAFVADFYSGTAQAISIKGLARNTLIVLTQIIPIHALSTI